jgi:hypothetical protein
LDLHKVEAWWQQNKKAAIRTYEDSIYPDGECTDLDPSRPETWLELLMLSAFQTMGRVTPEQHRGFLELCNESGYMNAFLEPSQPELWHESFFHFLERNDQHSYYNWFRQYPAILQCSKWLPQYIEIFQQINKLTTPISLEQIFDPNQALHLQGTGINAPSLGRALGTVGQHFLLRELVRRGFLKNINVHQHCYVPNRSIKKLFSCESSGEIYHHVLSKFDGNVTRASFDGAFDVAVRMYREKSSGQPLTDYTDEELEQLRDLGLEESEELE